MYAQDSAYTQSSTPDSSYGPAPGKSTMTSRLDGSGSGTAPAGTPPAPAALLALAGLPLNESGFMFVLEASGAFTVLSAPPGQEGFAGRGIPPGSSDPTVAQAWQALADRMMSSPGTSTGQPAAAPGVSTGQPAAAPPTATASTGGLGALILAALAACSSGGGGGAVPKEPWLDDPGGPAGAPAAAPADPVSEAMARYKCTMTVAKWMIENPLPLPDLTALRQRVENALAQDPEGHGTLGPDLAAKELAHLRPMLDGAPPMTEEQIQWAHRIIPHQPGDTPGLLFQELQTKSPYANERDNEAKWPGSGDKVEEPDGNMCNFTSLAMCLQYLGVPKPGPDDVKVPAGVDAATLQYEDALFYVWVKLGCPGGNIIGFSAWTPVCAALGCVGTNQGAFAGKKADWESVIRDGHLGAGHAVMAGGWKHVVRIQAVTEAGVIVDDPYGGSTMPDNVWPGGKNSRDGTGDGAVGDNCTWAWPENQIIELGYYYTVARG